MPIPLVRVVWDNSFGFLWIEESSYDPNIHQLYVEPEDDEAEPVPPAKTTRRKAPVNDEES